MTTNTTAILRLRSLRGIGAVEKKSKGGMRPARNLLLTAILAAGMQALTPATASAVPVFDLSYGASVFDSATRTLDRLAGTSQGAVAVPEAGVTITGGFASASGIVAGTPQISLTAIGTGTVTAGAQGDLIYYLFVAGPAGLAHSVPVLMDVMLTTTIQGDNATAGAHFNVTSIGLLNDGTAFNLGVGCFTNAPFANICAPAGAGFDGQLVFGLTPGDTYQIDLGAGVGAGGTPLQDAATAVADPHIFIDPNYDNTLGYQLILSDGVGNDLPNGGPPSAVPEPSTLFVFGLGLAMLASLSVRARRASY